VLAPADPMEVRATLRAALRHDGPAYIRMGKKGEPNIHREVPSVEIGRSLIVREGVDVCLLAVGVLLPMALEAAEALAQRGISARVVSVISVKPLDRTLLKETLARFPVVVTIEEHSLIGGFGGAVAEWSIDNGPFAARLVRMGTADRFLHEAGETDHARAANGLSTAHIVERVTKAMPPRQTKKAIGLS
jgi:transketolase